MAAERAALRMINLARLEKYERRKSQANWRRSTLLLNRIDITNYRGLQRKLDFRATEFPWFPTGALDMRAPFLFSS
jgi:hypothetical protein